VSEALTAEEREWCDRVLKQYAGRDDIIVCKLVRIHDAQAATLDKLLCDWINSLPEPFRTFVMRLETDADPSGNIRDAVCQKENAMALAADRDTWKARAEAAEMDSRSVRGQLGVMTRVAEKATNRAETAEARVRELEKSLQTEVGIVTALESDVDRLECATPEPTP